jgi:hypothetical protein
MTGADDVPGPPPDVDLQPQRPPGAASATASSAARTTSQAAPDGRPVWVDQSGYVFAPSRGAPGGR